MRIRRVPAVRKVSFFIGVPMIGLIGVGAHAVELTPKAALFSEYTNNSGRSSRNEESELENNLSVGFEMQESSNRYDYLLDYLITRTHFERNTFEDRTTTIGSANANFSILPYRLLWQVAHFQDYQKIDAQAADVPDNRSERSIFQTGPRLLFDFSAVDRVIVDARYIDTSFENLSTNDSERNQANATWEHRYSELGSVSLIGHYIDTEFDDGSIEYDQTGIGLGLSGQLKDGRYSVEFGKSKIDRDDSGETEANFLTAELDLLYGSHAISFTFIRELTDSSIGLGLSTNIDREFDSGDTNFDIVDILERERAQISYRKEDIILGGSLEVLLFRDEDDFKNRLEDEKRTGLVTRFNYDVTERDSLEVAFTYQEVDPIDNELFGVDEYQRFDVVWGHKLSSRLELRVGANYQERHNDDNALQEYDSAGALIGLYYSMD